MVYSTRRFVVCLSVCHFVLVFFSTFSIAITSLEEERANLSAFRTFVRFVFLPLFGHCGCIGTYNCCMPLATLGKSQRHQAVIYAFGKSWELADEV